MATPKLMEACAKGMHSIVRRLTGHSAPEASPEPLSSTPSVPTPYPNVAQSTTVSDGDPDQPVITGRVYNADHEEPAAADALRDVDTAEEIEISYPGVYVEELPSAPAAGDTIPQETMSLNFEEIKVTYDSAGNTSDDYGRVKVQFNWDREGEKPENAAAGDDESTNIESIPTPLQHEQPQNESDLNFVQGFAEETGDSEGQASLGDIVVVKELDSSLPASGGMNELRFEDKPGHEASDLPVESMSLNFEKVRDEPNAEGGNEVSIEELIIENEGFEGPGSRDMVMKGAKINEDAAPVPPEDLTGSEPDEGAIVGLSGTPEGQAEGKVEVGWKVEEGEKASDEPSGIADGTSNTLVFSESNPASAREPDGDETASTPDAASGTYENSSNWIRVSQSPAPAQDDLAPAGNDDAAVDYSLKGDGIDGESTDPGIGTNETETIGSNRSETPGEPAGLRSDGELVQAASGETAADYLEIEMKEVLITSYQTGDDEPSTLADLSAGSPGGDAEAARGRFEDSSIEADDIDLDEPEL